MSAHVLLNLLNELEKRGNNVAYIWQNTNFFT